MAFERITCEVYYKINTWEIYSEYRSTHDYVFLEFEDLPDAERFLATEGYTRGYTRGDYGWYRLYQKAGISRNVREVKE